MMTDGTNGAKIIETCPTCEGSGVYQGVLSPICSTCDGEGRVLSESTRPSFLDRVVDDAIRTVRGWE